MSTVFTILVAESETFASLTGDYNPIHRVPAYGQQTQFGGTIVHGLHLVFKALEALSEHADDLLITNLTVKFRNPVSHGDRCDIQISELKDEQYIVKIRNADSEVMRMKVRIGGQKRSDTPVVQNISLPVAEPLPLQWADIKDSTKELGHYWDINIGRKLFPHLTENQSHWQLSSLASLTRIVGNFCPGLNSVFAGFSISFDKPAEELPLEKIIYSVSDLDERFNLVGIKVRSGCFQADIDARHRVPRVVQASYAVIKETIGREDLSGKNVLVVGGSRGIGEMIVKLLAARGAMVTFTYANSVEAAKAIESEINSAGGNARAIKLDIENDLNGIQNKKVGEKPASALFYFATPKIKFNLFEPWDEKQFQIYNKFYVDGFARLISYLKQQGDEAFISALQPSTDFLNQPTIGTGEYCASKSALEVYSTVNSTDQLRIWSPRIPAVLTDQTAGQDAEGLSDLLLVSRDLVYKSIPETPEQTVLTQ